MVSSKSGKHTRKTMKMVPVSSTQISAIGHDPEKNILRIRFKDFKTKQDGATYEYSNVDAQTHADLVNAESIGRAFRQGLKTDPKRWPNRKLTPEEAAQ